VRKNKRSEEKGALLGKHLHIIQKGELTRGGGVFGITQTEKTSVAFGVKRGKSKNQWGLCV